MPALPNVPNVIRNVLKFTTSEDTAAAVRFFLQYTGGAPTNAEMATFAAGIGTAFAAHLIGLGSDSVGLQTVTSTDLSTDTAGSGEAAPEVTCTRGATINTSDACLLESLHVNRRYRGGHPRLYWPFGVQGDLESGQHWSEGFLTTAGSDLSDWWTALNALTWSGGSIIGRVNVSYYSGFTVHDGVTGRARNVSTPRSSAVVDTVVSSVVQPGIASQRRRLLRLA
jgi:hypothetical protein